jgi:hypothetical protein
MGDFGLCPHQPYQNWATNYLAQDSNAQGRPKNWLQYVKGTPTSPLAAKKLAINQTYVKVIGLTNILVGPAGAINQTDPMSTFSLNMNIF